MNEENEAGGRPECDPTARSLEEALARARRHARNAVAEALEALRALLDATSFATSGAPAGDHPLFARASGWIRAASERLASDAGLPRDVVAALAEALDGEIARWEAQARIDPDARAVLRAFLGLRELLWELGVRPSPIRPRDAGDAPRGTSPATRRQRVERVVVEG